MIMRGDTRLTRLIAPTKLSSVWHQCMDFQLPSALSTTPETAGPTEGRVIQHVGLADRKCWASFLYARCSSPKKAMEALSAAANISVYIYTYITITCIVCIHIYLQYIYIIKYNIPSFHLILFVQQYTRPPAALDPTKSEKTIRGTYLHLHFGGLMQVQKENNMDRLINIVTLQK